MTERDRFRYCVHCGVDCYVAWYDEENAEEGFDPSRYADDVEHKPDCPSVTGMYPIDKRALSPWAECPECGHGFSVNGMTCMDCGVEFKLGDTYAHRQTKDDMFEVVCTGCALLNPSEMDRERAQ